MQASAVCQPLTTAIASTEVLHIGTPVAYCVVGCGPSVETTTACMHRERGW